MTGALGQAAPPTDRPGSRSRANSASTPPDWEAWAATLKPDARPFIDGERRESAGGARFETINPATNEAVCEVPAGCAADVDCAAVAARRAFDAGVWRGKAPNERKLVLLRLADLVDQNGDELALLDCLEMGKAIANARAEIAMTSGYLRYCAEAIDKLYGEVAPGPDTSLSLSLLEPRGVVGAIVPWNFPLANAGIKAAPALAAGNSLILKPSELASLSALRLAELAYEAGVPSGVFNVVPGLGSSVGEAIGRHQDIDFLSFTGSTTTGRRLMAYAGQSNGKPLMLELGGKSAQIICADCLDDLPRLAAQIVHEAFWNQGQWCAARSRAIVEASVHDRVLEAVIGVAEKLKPGDPLDPHTKFGTIASAAQFDRIVGYIERGHSESGACALPGAIGDPTSASIAPTIFQDVAPGAAIVRDEVFGPVLCVQRFVDFNDALALANDTPYGLSATLWTRDAVRQHAAMRALRTGKIVLKTRPAAVGGAGFALSAEPWGASGFGAERGLEGLRSYCRRKAVEMII